MDNIIHNILLIHIIDITYFDENKRHSVDLIIWNDFGIIKRNKTLNKPY